MATFSRHKPCLSVVVPLRIKLLFLRFIGNGVNSFKNIIFHEKWDTYRDTRGKKREREREKRDNWRWKIISSRKVWNDWVNGWKTYYKLLKHLNLWAAALTWLGIGVKCKLLYFGILFQIPLPLMWAIITQMRSV